MTDLDPHVVLFKRQCLQLTNLKQLTMPPRAVLKKPDIQAQIYQSMFRTDSLKYPLPERYKSRVLKLLVKELEQSVDDPDEDLQEISDELTSCLAETLANPIVSDVDDPQRRSYVTYSAPLPLDSPQTQMITTLESPDLLAAAGTTGLRTWEAAKFLASFLCRPGGDEVRGKTVIELGAGTGLVSMYCARHLGAEFVLATDGTGEVVDSIVENMFLNQLDERKYMDAVVLKWGYAIMPELVLDEEGLRNYNLVIGTDIIFDDRLIHPLVSTLHELFDMYHDMKGLIAATVRNVETVNKFQGACSSRSIDVAVIATSLQSEYRNQTGLFHSIEPEIKIFELVRSVPARPSK